MKTTLFVSSNVFVYNPLRGIDLTEKNLCTESDLQQIKEFHRTRPPHPVYPVIIIKGIGTVTLKKRKRHPP